MTYLVNIHFHDLTLLIDKEASPLLQTNLRLYYKVNINISYQICRDG